MVSVGQTELIQKLTWNDVAYNLTHLGGEKHKYAPGIILKCTDIARTRFVRKQHMPAC